MISKDLIRSRVKKVRKILKDKNIKYLLLTSQANVTFTTGFLGHDSWAFFTPNQVYLMTDSRYIEQAEKECPACKLVLRDITLANTLPQVLAKYKNVRRIAIEDCTTLMQLKMLEKSVKAKFYPVSKIVEPVRSIKDPTELAYVKKAVQISVKALKATLDALRVGMTENEAAGVMDYHFRKFGGCNGFDTIMAFGANGSRCHHQPGSTKLKANDTVLIDYGAEYEHYRCDITRTFLIGKPNPFFENVYKTVHKAQAAAISIFKPGLSNREPEKQARKVISDNGLPPYEHGSGHGFGLIIHEDPFLSVLSKDKLAEGMILTIEPGIYLPGKLGVRIEDDCIITKTGCRVLTSMIPKDYKSICLGDISKRK